MVVMLRVMLFYLLFVGLVPVLLAQDKLESRSQKAMLPDDGAMVLFANASQFVIDPGGDKTLLDTISENGPTQGRLQCEFNVTGIEDGKRRVVWMCNEDIEFTKDLGVFVFGKKENRFIDSETGMAIEYTPDDLKVRMTFRTNQDTYKRKEFRLPTSPYAHQARDAFNAKGQLLDRIDTLQKRLEEKDEQVVELREALLSLYRIVNDEPPESLTKPAKKKEPAQAQ